ncbi:MAG: response regulator [Gemmatimonadota bacterium]|nr:response regulator [Gemmatimonadota bacterium]
MRQIRLLLVDDAADFRASAADFLARDPRVVVAGQAANGATGLRLAESLHPDLVLMDLAMPGMNGLEATHRLKESASPPVVHIVSIQDDAVVRGRAADVGADGFIPKLDFSEGVAAAIDAWFAARGSAAP